MSMTADVHARTQCPIWRSVGGILVIRALPFGIVQAKQILISVAVGVAALLVAGAVLYATPYIRTWFGMAVLGANQRLGSGT